MRKTCSLLLVIARRNSSCLIPSLSVRCSLELLKRVDLETTFSEVDKVLSGNCDNTPETAPKKVQTCERGIAESQASEMDTGEFVVSGFWSASNLVLMLLWYGLTRRRKSESACVKSTSEQSLLDMN